MAIHIVIVGGSFGGLTAAFELRHHLDPDQVKITLISKNSRFVFIPSLPWVAIGRRNVDEISFALAPVLARKYVDFVCDSVERIDAAKKTVSTGAGDYRYDFLVVATGHRSANEKVPGLGPFDGPGHSLMSAPEAEELNEAIAHLLHQPGPVVVAAAPGASCIGPAYEFAFEIDHLLRRRRLRHQVPITFVTPEPFLGHMGMGGAGAIRQMLEGALDERDIPYQTSAAVTGIGVDAVEVAGSGSIPSALSMVIPPLAGVAAVANSPGLANPNGFVPVDERYRHPDADGVYAIGVATAMPPVAPTPVPVNFPKTGDMTEQMATVAAADIVARITGGEATVAELRARCVMDMGDEGIYMSVDPVRPPRDTIPTISKGRRWLWAKRAFERTYLFTARHGRRVPTALGW
ncbi:NAD(P)/FAD-dependent oxidoreductase [Mycobacterium pseudokansasii]|uniref:Sulfide-quinone reductase n=1 Tax=Mycobacterium pseudokansasii TaxID=2341080 RepID=A0A498QHE0_9MYCO|nr:FAD-dependent oxidoreductase [Mycobacterium pseudokansasii]MBY0389963.1 FAD-dependent oxidoreductase [Mycobacterium pseudokansasii]VAZ88590.1 Sulfide-quinone reductase [Mycobacterium pseudokansasii]VAZ89060.1 Sulfide-quinone reductase [Mycobacterium pseudokansasii]VBA46768.1 Sulfide-quinone reductase [Mycobacterium pseudokansasii]